MDRFLRDYVMRRMHDDRRDYERDRTDYEDSRRSSKDYGSHHVDDYRQDYRRDGEDGKGYYYGDFKEGRDYHDAPVRLSKHDFKKWDSMIENFDGTRGYHYDTSKVIAHAEKMGIRFRDFSEKELCAATNMMYADYGKVVKKYAKSPEDELEMCIELAKGFLDDPDGPDPSEKLALYFHCIVNA